MACIFIRRYRTMAEISVSNSFIEVWLCLSLCHRFQNKLTLICVDVIGIDVKVPNCWLKFTIINTLLVLSYISICRLKLAFVGSKQLNCFLQIMLHRSKLFQRHNINNAFSTHSTPCTKQKFVITSYLNLISSPALKEAICHKNGVHKRKGFSSVGGE